MNDALYQNRDVLMTKSVFLMGPWLRHFFATASHVKMALYITTIQDLHLQPGLGARINVDSEWYKGWPMFIQQWTMRLSPSIQNVISMESGNPDVVQAIEEKDAVALWNVFKKDIIDSDKTFTATDIVTAFRDVRVDVRSSTAFEDLTLAYQDLWRIRAMFNLVTIEPSGVARDFMIQVGALNKDIFGQIMKPGAELPDYPEIVSVCEKWFSSYSLLSMSTSGSGSFHPGSRPASRPSRGPPRFQNRRLISNGSSSSPTGQPEEHWGTKIVSMVSKEISPIARELESLNEFLSTHYSTPANVVVHRVQSPRQDGLSHGSRSRHTRGGNRDQRGGGSSYASTASAAPRREPQRRSEIDVPPDTCQVCLQKGHWKRDCPRVRCRRCLKNGKFKACQTHDTSACRQSE